MDEQIITQITEYGYSQCEVPSSSSGCLEIRSLPAEVVMSIMSSSDATNFARLPFVCWKKGIGVD